MNTLAPQIEEDRQTLIDLMEEMDIPKNPVKQATTWVAEKASRAKFGGLRATETGLGIFMALETLSLGEGKLCLWIVLREVADEYPPLRSVDLEELIERARSQRSALERERVAAGRLALLADAVTASARGRTAVPLDGRAPV
jgi:hypothetical protein